MQNRAPTGGCPVLFLYESYREPNALINQQSFLVEETFFIF